MDRWFRVGGWTIRLRFAGPALVPQLTPALDHLAVAPAGEPDLTLCVWDTASTGVSPARPAWAVDAYTPRGEIRGHLDGRILTAFSLGTYTLSTLDLETGVGAYWVRAADQLPPWELAAPLRTLLGWWAASRGGQLSHGAAVGRGEDGILLAGRSGSGKSTTALASLERGLRYAGDDYVLIRPDAGAPAVHSLYCTAKLHPDHMAGKLPGLAGCTSRITAPDYDKAILLLQDAFPDLLAERLRIRVIVVPTVSPSRTTALRPASAIAVLKALAPTTLFQLPGAGTEALRTMAVIAQGVPGYVLEVGPDLDEVVAAVQSLLPPEADGSRIHG